jgi:hypothetical protein
MAEFTKISKNGDGKQKAILKYKEKDGKTVYLPVVLSGRGNSRGNNCSFKPFRMAFTTKELRLSLEKNLEERRRDPESNEYLKYYYDEFVAANYDLKSEGKPDKDSLFSGLGDDVKVVTHCGVARNGGDWPGGLKVEDQDQRLLAEYYVYEVLSKLKVTYYDQLGKPVFDDNGAPMAKFAFFREPPSSLAKRCELLTKKPEVKKKKPAQNQYYVEETINKGSELSMNALNYFVINTDFGAYGEGKQGHNINFFYNASGEKFYGIYDFDLAGPVNAGQGYKYDKNQIAERFRNKSETLAQYLSGHSESKLANSLIGRFLKEEADMKAVVDNSLLNEEYKGNAKMWLDLQFLAIKKAANNVSPKPTKK